MSKEQPINLNISDFLKVFAVASVILQTVLSYVLTHSPQTEAMNSIGSFYRMSKYSAPMFIFAIIYNMVLKSQAESYLEFLKEKFYELVLPYVVWSSLYGTTKYFPYFFVISFYFFSGSPREFI